MAALAAQPLTVLPSTPEQTATFSLRGVRTLGELAVLPEAPLVSRMGQAGWHLRQVARRDLPQLPEASRLDVTLARIRALVGEGNVGCPVLKDAHSIDAFIWGHFASPRPNHLLQ